MISNDTLAPFSKSFSAVTVGVADLDCALDLWVNTFGLETIAMKHGTDEELSSLWQLANDDILRQALVGTPGQSQGRIHFVEFNQPGPPVREGAAAFDWCPKNLDIYVDDIVLRMEALKYLGHEFRSESYSEITAPNGMRVREIQMPAHDGLNIVLLQIIDEDLSFSPLGFSGVGPVITTVANAAVEREFYSSILELELVTEAVLEGPDVEQVIGLPQGSGLHFSVWGHPAAPLGRMEVISYGGVSGADLFGRAAPKARGILHVSYQFNELVELVKRLDESGIEFTRHGRVKTLSSNGETISFRSPAGFRIEAVQNE